MNFDPNDRPRYPQSAEDRVPVGVVMRAVHNASVVVGLAIKAMVLIALIAVGHAYVEMREESAARASFVADILSEIFKSKPPAGGKQK